MANFPAYPTRARNAFSRESYRPPRPAFEKSGEKPDGKRFRFSGGIYWRAAHRERPAGFVCRKPRRKGVADGSLGRWKIPAARAGRRARTARTKHGRGPLAPAHALVLRAWGPMGPRPAKRRRPAGAHPSASLLPRVSIPPSAQRRLPGGMQEAALALVETPAGGGGWARSALKERARGQRPQVRSFVWQAEGAAPRAAPSAAKRRRRSVRRSVRRGRRRSGAGAIGPGPGTCPLPGLPGSGRVGFAHPPPPRAAGIFANAKRATQKPGPTLYGAWLLKRSQEGARQRLHPLGQSPGPRSTGLSGFIRPAAGYRRKPPTAVVARLSPFA